MKQTEGPSNAGKSTHPAARRKVSREPKTLNEFTLKQKVKANEQV